MSRVITSLQLIHHALRPHKTQQHGRPQRKSSDRRIPPSHPSLSLFLLSLSLSHPSLLSLFHSVLSVFLLSLSLSLSLTTPPSLSLSRCSLSLSLTLLSSLSSILCPLSLFFLSLSPSLSLLRLLSLSLSL